MNMQNSPPPIPTSPLTSDRKKSGQSMAALILTCIGIFIFPLLIIGIILGHLALSKHKLGPVLSGRKIAKAALIIGYCYISLIIACVLLFLLVPTGR
jgi:hypothetical protein